MSKLPDDVHAHYLPDQLRRVIPDLGPVFYIDNWPFSPPILVIASPPAACQYYPRTVASEVPGIAQVLATLDGDTRINSQRSHNEMVSALRRQIPWLTFGAEVNPIQRYHPFRPLVHWYNARQMNKYISRVLEDRFAACTFGEARHSKSVINLALNKYLAANSSLAGKGMDATFKAFAVSQIKLFNFSRHDTTSSSICYVFYLLSKHPAAFDRLRAEHNEVFGPEVTQSASLIAKDPHYPTEGFLVWFIHQARQREPAYWPSPDAFIPERWLVPQGDPLHPIKGAAAFELGPRNCIGQELAMMEIKIAMAMTLREFNVKAVYEEWDLLKSKGGRKTVEGERAYQIILAQPSDGLPCRVEVAVE
ncbi:MAG: hypothetical protein M1816_004592 [Peltula sp. TS41687]|nr:MAG: hypothetical protein M1816_004592 [Peltula sp. TS41687]